ncbi:hypothetical protein ACWGCC_03815 [Streptomyces nigrescens]
MGDITHPDYFLQLARTVDGAFDELPQTEELRRGDDISPAIQTAVGGISHMLTEISEELVTSNRHESQARSSYSLAERSGTAALTKCAVPLGVSLAHLGQVISRLGFLHENIRHSSTERTPAPDDVQLVLQEHLDRARTGLLTAAHHLRVTATQLSRPHPTRTATAPSHVMSDTVSACRAAKSSRAR